MKDLYFSNFLTGAAMSGSVGILYFSSKAGIDASKKWEEDDTFLDKVKKSWKDYIFPVFLTAGTICCISGSNRLNKTIQASMLSAYCFADRRRKEYKNALASVTDEVSAEAVEIIVDDGYVETYVKKDPSKIVIVDNYLKIPFEAHESDILHAEYELNRTYRKRHYASLHDFYRYLGIPETSLSKKFGWSVALLEDSKDPEFNVDWIDFKHTKCKDKNGNDYLVIGYEYEPVFGYLVEEF